MVIYDQHKPTSLARLNKEHLWFPFQRCTVLVCKVVNKLEDFDWLSVSCVDDSELSVRHDAANKGIVVGVVCGIRFEKECQQIRLVKVSVHFDLELEVIEQLLNKLCKISKLNQHIRVFLLLA